MFFFFLPNIRIKLYSFVFVYILIEQIYSRSQTTKGIWLAKCADIEPSTLVMDLEGSDGRERGEVLI